MDQQESNNHIKAYERDYQTAKDLLLTSNDISPEICELIKKELNVSPDDMKSFCKRYNLDIDWHRVWCISRRGTDDFIYSENADICPCCLELYSSGYSADHCACKEECCYTCSSGNSDDCLKCTAEEKDTEMEFQIGTRAKENEKPDKNS